MNARERVLTAVCFAVVANFSMPALAYEVSPTYEKCGDNSFSQYLKDGVTVGIVSAPPHSYLNTTTGKAEGIDVEINEAAFKWMGITSVKYEVTPVGQLVPGLISKRIDVIGTNIHVTPDRIKAISFTGPSWWYGPIIVLPANSELQISSYADLKGKKVGAVVGSAADEYLRKIGAESVAFPGAEQEIGALSTARVDAVLEDDVTVADWVKSNPKLPIKQLKDVPVPEEMITRYGYGYARYGLRKDDCTFRAAYTQALAEVRGTGEVAAILKKYGLSNRNLFLHPLDKD
ncbi:MULTISPECIES: transporter substrate-binding domain-containing protein [Pseudomonas]|uniref:transporter substrate-binding domain-containing protein n=1 Tax=Pseudomonas TaxID=286 RepID=UPI000CFBEC01|nr:MULTISPECIES: transporter substrate-binding domain-containing protein [Pseudomonas]PQZ87657.1 ABC transporter substrate-binding protein [Pseudomonas trivialis]PRB23591.1 ABC transporter substrate-binding protein [Pseudomonas sp. MYb60]